MRIGPYEVTRTLGQGGMGTVYAARSADGREVAVKVLRRSGAEVVARFERERRLLASFTEAQGFVTLLDAGTSPQGPYLVMPLVPGGTLRQRLESGPLSVNDTIELGRALAQSLGSAHSRGIVHRDMKPENVLFSADSRPLIADLGLAKHFDADAPGASQSVDLTASRVFHGTAGYMAGEQMQDVRSAGPPADVFALGAILYECLAGRPAFGGDTRIQVVTLVDAGTFTPLRSIAKDTPEWLSHVIERALARDPAERFADGLAFGRALAAGAPRKRAALFTLVALGCALALGAVFLARGGLSPEQPRTLTPAPTADQLLRQGLEELARDDVLGATSHATKAIAADPGLAQAWALRGEARYKNEVVEGALADCTKAIALDPKLARAWLWRGATRILKDDYDGALEDCSQALALAPTLAEAWSYRGLARQGKGDMAGALADGTKAVAFGPGLAFAWTHRAFTREAMGDHDGAIADCDAALALDRSLSKVWHIRARARSEKGDDEGAIADCTEAIALGPKDASYRVWRGVARTKIRAFDDAIADFSEALVLDPRLPTAWSRRGNARELKGDLAGAIDDCTRAIALDPADPSAWAIRGFALQAKGDLDGATRDYEKSLALAPDGPIVPSIRKNLEALRAR